VTKYLSPEGGDASATFFTIQMVRDGFSCVELADPFSCRMEFEKVDCLRYIFRCSVTGRKFDVQVWADPAFLRFVYATGRVISYDSTNSK